MTKKFTTRNGMLWVQPDGPNTAVHMLGCHSLGDLEIPEGEIELVRCWKNDRSGWDIVGQKETPPDPVSFEVELLLESTRDYLEEVTCPFGMYATQVECGRVDEFSNYTRGLIMANVRRTGRTYTNLVHREEDNESTLTAALQAWNVYPIDALRISRETTAATLALNDVAFNVDTRCANDCGATLKVGEQGLIGVDSAAGPATGDILFSTDFGETWAAGATDPFGAGFHTMAVAKVTVNGSTNRVIAGREGTGAVQGQMAYSDDNGATWTVVSIGGAAVGHGPTFGHGIWVIDRYNIFVASADGFIYKSSDGGVTYTAVESGTIHVGENHFVHFADATYGFAGGAAGVTSISNDGGANWTAGGIPAASPARCGWRLDKNRLWVGLDNGAVYYSLDGGTTWTQRTGFPAGAIRSMFWLNEYQGYLLHNTAAPLGTVYHTNNGGYTWEAVTTPTNDGLNSIWMASPDLGYIVGEASGGTGFIGKIYAAY